MNPVEQRAKTQSPRTAAFALLAGPFLAAGSGARHPVRPRAFVGAALATLLTISLLAPAGASAHFVRPFLRQIPGPASGPFTGANPRSVALDAAGDVWVGETQGQPGEVPFSLPFHLDQFEPSGVPLKTLAIAGPPFLLEEEIKGVEHSFEQGPTPPESLAIDRSTETFYTVGNENDSKEANDGYAEIFDDTGGYLGRFGGFEAISGIANAIAVDNSSTSSAGSVYLTHKSEGSVGIEKFTAAGAPSNFSCTTCSSYLSANRITGTPSGPFATGIFGDGPSGSIAVDSAGNIYVTDPDWTGAPQEGVVLEFAASGEFVQAFNGLHKPASWNESFNVRGVAVDPLSGDVLVSFSNPVNQAAVDEFDSQGDYLGQVTATTPGRGLTATKEAPIQMAAGAHGELFLAEDGSGTAAVEHAIDVYGEGQFVPGLSLGEATRRTKSTAVLSGSVNPEALVNPEHGDPGFVAISDCHFEYVTAAAYAASGFEDLSSGGSRPCSERDAAEIPADETAHAVHADLSGLSAGTTYRYRLSATAGGAHGGSAHTAALAFTAPQAPRIEADVAENVSSTFAELHATIDPLGAGTSYYFQYLTAEQFAANGGSFSGPDTPTLVPVPAAEIGAGGATGSSPESVVQHLGGLSPATAYDFRVLAANECEAGARCLSEGADQTFATLPQVTPGLPDGRAYELITPPDKGSAEDIFAGEKFTGEYGNTFNVVVPSESGNQLLFETKAAYGSFPGSGRNAYVFSRTPAGWTGTSLAVPGAGVQSFSQGVLVDPLDFSRVAFTAAVGSAASPLGTSETSFAGSPGGPYTTLHADPAQHAEAGEAAKGSQVVGASHDLSQVVLQSGSHTLIPGGPAEAQDPGSNALYDYAGGEPTLLNVEDEGKLLSRCGAVLGYSSYYLHGSEDGVARDALSADGSRAFFTAPDPEMTPPPVAGGPGGKGCWNGATTNAPQLYMRSGGQTLEVSAPEPGAPEAGGRYWAEYVGAAEDGSRVFFLSEGELTNDDQGIHDHELYEYDVETAKLTRISAGASGDAAASVWTVPAVSADGSAVYFTAFGALAPGAKSLESIPRSYIAAEKPVNLYRYDTATATTTYIATVDTRDYVSGKCQSEVALCANANWETTPNGRYLLFATTRELTGYSTRSPGESENTYCYLNGRQGEYNGHCEELYRYDSASSSLTCVSCNPSGAAPVSNSLFSRSAPGFSANSAPPRAISADGAYVFFDTADALVPQDTNKALDVYEWHEGRLALISSGHDPAPSFFLNSSPDGANVFFGTHAALVPQDADSEGDLYDARICTESDPCLQPPAGETAQCLGGECQKPPPAPPDPVATLFSPLAPIGLAPPAPAKKLTTKKAATCKRGYVRRKVRNKQTCVKKPKPKKRAKKSAHTNRRTSR